MTDEGVIPGRRLIGFVAFALAAVVGTMAFGSIVGSCQPGLIEPTTSPVLATPSPPVPAIASPSSFDAPGGQGTIPPFVPIPSGPFP